MDVKIVLLPIYTKTAVETAIKNTFFVRLDDGDFLDKSGRFSYN